MSRSSRKPQRQQPLDHPESDDQVLSFAEWCALNRISERTGRRIIKSDNAPVITWLTERMYGVTRGNNRRWQAQRAGRSA
jgi:hypothetical protein